MSRFQPKHIILDCPASLAKDIIISHVRDLHLGRRTYHYLIAGLVNTNILFTLSLFTFHWTGIVSQVDFYRYFLFLIVFVFQCILYNIACVQCSKTFQFISREVVVGKKREHGLALVNPCGIITISYQRMLLLLFSFFNIT